MKISCAILEDEPRAIEIIQRYIERVDFLQLKATRREPLKAIDLIDLEKIELLFLDISLPDINGLHFYKSLTHKPLVIFTTAYPEHAVDSYEIEAVDYLLKPISFERFLKSVSKAKNAIMPPPGLKRDQAIINVKSGGQLHVVRMSDILYLQKDGNYLIMHIKGKQIVVRENMSDVFKIVPSGEFIRVHKSYVVSLQHVEMIESHQVTVAKTRIPLGATYRESFMKRFDSHSLQP